MMNPPKKKKKKEWKIGGVCGEGVGMNGRENHEKRKEGGKKHLIIIYYFHGDSSVDCWNFRLSSP